MPRTRAARLLQVHYPARPVLAGLAIPVGVVLLDLAGALGAGGAPFVVLALALGIPLGLWVLRAVLALGPPVAWVRTSAVVLLALPLIVAPALSARATQETVLRERGVARPGVVVGVRVEHGHTAGYICTVRYDGTSAWQTLPCRRSDRTGEPVVVVADRDGWARPAFGSAVAGAASDRTAVLLADLLLLLLAGAPVAAGHLARRRIARPMR